jgi:adenine-specific DNA-methyltransferase
MLNTIALWDCPAVPDIADAKCAIRTDWRTERRSLFNTASSACAALCKLLDLIDSRWVLMSYSTDGNIPVDQLVSVFAERGSLSVVGNSYKRYRVSSQRMSERSHNVEFVLILDKSGRPNTGKSDVLQEIFAANRELLPEPLLIV